MEVVENDNQDGHLSIWHIFNSTTNTLFKNLEQASDGLESLLTSLLNHKREFSDVLIPRSTLPQNLKNNYVAFSKWLLGRLFYLLSVKKLSRLHANTISAQLKILSLLYTNGATFFTEIVQEYLSSLHQIIEFYNGKTGKKKLILRQFVPGEIDIDPDYLDLGAIDVEITESIVCKNLIKYLLQIVCQIVLSTNDFKIPQKSNCALEDALYIMEHFDIELKCSAIEFFSMIVDRFGLMCNTKYISKFFILLESLLKNLQIISVLQNKELENLNSQLAQFFSLLVLLGPCKNSKVNDTILNISKQILDIGYNLDVLIEMDDIDTWETSNNEYNEQNYTSELKEICKELMSKFYIKEDISKLNSAQFDCCIESIPTVLYSKIISEIKSQSLNVSQSSQGNVVPLSLISVTFKRLSTIFVLAIDTASCDNVNYSAVKKHLKKVYSIMDIFYKIRMYFYNSDQRREELFKNKFELHNTSKIFNDSLLNSTQYEYFPESCVSTLITRMINLLKVQLQYSKRPLAELVLLNDFFSKLLNMENNLKFHNLETMSEISLLSMTNKSSALERISSVSQRDLCLDVNKVNSLNTLLTHMLFMKASDVVDRWRNVVVNLLKTSIDANNEVLFVGIIKNAPLILLNKILPPNELIANYLHTALFSKDENILKTLVNTLPIIVCMLSGHFAVVQSAEGICNENLGYTLIKRPGMVVDLICLHCYDYLTADEAIFEALFSRSNIMIMVDKSCLTPCETNNIVPRFTNMLKKFLNIGVYRCVDESHVANLIHSFAKHSILQPAAIDEILKEESLKNIAKIIRNIITSILDDNNLDDTLKNSIVEATINFLLKCTKKSLETNDKPQQEACLEAIRQFGLAPSPRVILPSVKMLTYYIMCGSCPYGSKAAVFIRDICESHQSSPNQIYHRYKKDFCRVLMEMASHNYLLGQGFAPTVMKIGKAFGFVGYREFVSKDIYHALPYLIPIIVTTEKLKPIIPEIASLIYCSPEKFLRERFAYLYSHIYIYENEIMAEKCFKYILDVIGIPRDVLIKEHFRIILTELLLQYCCGPEKVLKACRQLATRDPEYAPKPSGQHLPLTAVADFIQPRFLGVLAYFDSKLVNSKVALSVKRKALQSFPDILNLMGPVHMTTLRFKILATLRTAMTMMSEFPLLNAKAWNAFVHNVDTAVLGPMLTTIFVSLLPLLPHNPKEINEILEYLIVNNENLLCNHIPDLFFVEDANISHKVKAIVQKHVTRIQPSSFIEKLNWYLKSLKQDTSEIKIHTLKFLRRLIKTHQTDIDNAIFGSKNIHHSIVELFDTLIAGCRDKDSSLSEWSAICLGNLGALQPSLLPRRPASLKEGTSFAFNIRDASFIKAALNELCRASLNEKYTKNMDCYALAIQEILKAFNISPNGDKKALWDSFPENVQQIMAPLVNSRYTLAFPTNPKKVHPVYGSNLAATFNEWTFNWSYQLIPLIDMESIQEVLRMVRPSLKRDLRTSLLFLPYIVLHAIVSNGSDTLTMIKEEILSVIGLDSFDSATKSKVDIPKYKILRSVNLTPIITPVVLEEGTQVKCSKMVYVILDFLNQWVLEWQSAKKSSGLQDRNYIRISEFLDSFCKLTIAQGNFLCGESERALQYLERYMTESSERLQEQLGFLAEIYSVLNEPDAVAGIMRMKQSEPSLSELILAHEVTGQLQDAATCYEKCAQQGDIDEDRLQGMMDVYLGLDQPYTALRLLQGTSVDDAEEKALAAEPFWRLGMFDDLEKLLEEPSVSTNDRWGVRVGHCLLSLRSGNRSDLPLRLSDARSSLMRRLAGAGGGGGSSESVWDYTHAYNSVLCLHMLSEIEHAEESVYKIKTLKDGSTGCMEIIEDLMQEWSLRLRLVKSSARTVEPVLRLRRILLEQSKELLNESHPHTASLFDAHIGKTWLQSSKFARKASIFQQAYIYILNGEKCSPKELFIEKAKLHWMRGQQESAFYTLKRGLEEHFPDLEHLSDSDRKLCAKAKLLNAVYNEETVNVDMDVTILHYKEAVEVYHQWEKSLVCLASYYEKVYAALSPEEKNKSCGGNARGRAVECYGRAMQYGQKLLYQSMPRMLSIWLDYESEPTDTKSPTVISLVSICSIIDTFSQKLPLYFFLTAFSQIISRICHPVKEVYIQLKSLIIKLIVEFPQHSLWMMMSVIKSSYSHRIKRCREIMNDPRLREPGMIHLIHDFDQLGEKLIELCNKAIPKNVQKTHITSLVRSLPRLLTSENFSQIMIPSEEFVKIMLPYDAVKKERDPNFSPIPALVYITGIEDQVSIFPSQQNPRRVTLKGSDGKGYMIMLKPKDDLRKDFRLMEFNAVVNRYLQESPEARDRRLYIRTYTVLPLNEECGLIQWISNLVGLRPILVHLYKQNGLHTPNDQMKSMMCNSKDSLAKKRKIFLEQLMPKHPPIFGTWFRHTFSDPHGWYQARSAYIRTTAVMSMVGYILGLGDRHGENILFDSTNGDTVHVDFNCLFNKGEGFEWPERVPFRLTHNMLSAMGPLGCEGVYRKCCEITLRVLRSQTPTLMSVIQPFVYDPLVAWQKTSGRMVDAACPERTNPSAQEHLNCIQQRLQGMVRTKDKHYSLSLSPEGQANNLILEATSIENLCQMYLGWGPFL